jgi:hypothetical protein
MLNQTKLRQVLFLALVGITFLLIIAAGWLYFRVQSGYGKSAGVLALTITTIIVLALICKGIQYAAAIEKAVRGQNSDPNHQLVGLPKPFKISGQALYQPSDSKDDFESPALQLINENKAETLEASFQVHKRRGKHSRFPISKITKAVLIWERRDPQFSSFTLTEFLEQEFGCGSDGILLMAPTTFYDWRRRILRDLELQKEKKSKDLEVEL